MDDLFRFMTVRGPQSADVRDTLQLTGAPTNTGPTLFQIFLRRLRNFPKSFQAMAALARAYATGSTPDASATSAQLAAALPWISSHILRDTIDLSAPAGTQPRSWFADPVSSLKLGAGMANLQGRLTSYAAGAPQASRPPQPNPTVLDWIDLFIGQAFAAVLGPVDPRSTAQGPHARALAASPDFADDMNRVHDTLVALFLSPSNARVTPGPGPEGLLAPTPMARRVAIEPLAGIARLMDLILRIAQLDKALLVPSAAPKVLPPGSTPPGPTPVHAAVTPAGVARAKSPPAPVVDAALTRTLLLPPAVFPISDSPMIQPVGVADLLVVRQQLSRYEPGEVTSIENLLQGEYLKYTNRHSLVTEESVTTETEKTTETSKDLKTTERFELQQEVANTLSQDLAVHAGVKVSAKFGDTVAINSHVDVAYSTSKSDATNSASSYAKEVTKRAASTVTERVRTEEITRTVETFEDEENHGFDNRAGADAARGIYQWVNKVYTAQVFNYGKRLLFDVLIPEPAAFLRNATRARAQSNAPHPPPSLTLTGNDGDLPLRAVDLSPAQFLPNVNFPNTYPDPLYYQNFVARYGAVGVQPPPAGHVVISKALAYREDRQDKLDDKWNIAASDLDVLTIPDGYVARKINVAGSFNSKNPGDIPVKDLGYELDVFVGSTRFYAAGAPPDGDYIAASGNLGQPQDAGSELGNIPIALRTKGIRDVGLTVEVTCRPSDIAIEQWKLQTFNAILDAYKTQYGAWLDQQASYQAYQQPAGGAAGGNPEQNRAIELRELKKAALQILAGVDLVDHGLSELSGNRDAVTDTVVNGQRFPCLDFDAAQRQGAFIRFFEQAFEWQQISYSFYPYYWGRTSTWYDKALLQNDDPLFLSFLKAGEARVVVPVRPGFEDDLWYYAMTGQIWSGGDLPHIGDTNYLPIIEEIKEQTGAPGAETPQGEPWDIVLPTKLVKLRADGKLPAWRWNKADPTNHWSWVDETDASKYI